MRRKTIIQATAGVLIGLIIVFIPLHVFLFNPQRTFHITETYRITAAYGSATYLRVSLPLSGAYQEITNVRIEGTADYTVEYFNGWRDVTMRVPPSEDEVLITISYTARLRRNAGTWEGEVHPEYLLPQQFIDSDHPNIIKLGEQLRGENDFETARNIFNHTHNHIQSPDRDRIIINGALPSASDLLHYPEGVCREYAILMTALLRAEGIPARSISGLALRLPLGSARDWGHQGVAHSWVEFYADGWHFADPSWGRRYFNRNGTAHLSFGTYESAIFSDFQEDRLTFIREDGSTLTGGGQSTPLKWTRFSTDENALVIPRAEVRFSWFARGFNND